MPTRRTVLGWIATSLPLAACASTTSSTNPPGPLTAGPEPAPRPSEAGESPAPQTGGVPRRPLGKTGVEVSIIGLGGHHIGLAGSEAAAVRLVHHAVDQGITFMDNCWDYHQGKSEEWMGKALAGGRRDKVFLMTKTDGHTRDACSRQLDQSLKRLQTEFLDLVQIHEVIRKDDPVRVFAKGGAIEALIEAKRAGKVRFIGFTGHKDPAYHLAMLAMADERGFRFDTVQLPLNVLDAHYKSFEQRVLPELVRRQIGVLGMKALGSGHVLQSGAASAEECLRYALTLPTSVVITGCEQLDRIEQALRIAREFKPLDAAERTALLARTRALAEGGEHEPFKTSGKFDGTIRNPHWLTTADVSGKT